MDKPNSTETTDPLEALRLGEEAVLKNLYRDHREEFISWACKHFRTDDDEAADVFQEAVITLYRNVVNGKLTELRSTLKTYLFGIGKNKLLKRSVKRSRTDYLDDSRELLASVEDVSFFEKEDLSHRQQMLREAIGKLSESCREIIRLFYYRRFSMEAIMQSMGYSSEEVARTTRLRCVKNLRGLVVREP